jgi:hypothetical protein
MYDEEEKCVQSSRRKETALKARHRLDDSIENGSQRHRQGGSGLN